MGRLKRPSRALAPLGCIEPHAQLLRTPSDNQLLYKVMTVENLLLSIAGKYLHFNRIDSYQDFQNADKNDGRQLPNDQPINANAKFEKAPDYSAADNYDQHRAKTYACCFSIENSDYIWNNYGNGSEKGKACVIFHFGKLRAALNSTVGKEGSAVLYEGNRCRQIFSVNYGLIDYVPWSAHRTNEKYLANPVFYTYLKDKQRFEEEKELRILLSPGFGLGHFALKDGTLMEFPPSLQLEFDFRNGIANSIIKEILFSSDADSGFLKKELSKAGIEAAPSPVGAYANNSK